MPAGRGKKNRIKSPIPHEQLHAPPKPMPFKDKEKPSKDEPPKNKPAETPDTNVAVDS